MATQTLDESLAAVEAMRKADVTQFETMARDAADGQPVDPTELNRVMLSTGKDLAAFRKLVEVFTRRSQLRQDIIIVREANERLVELKAEIEKHNAELEKHVAAHQAACRPIQSEISRLREITMIKGRAQQELFNTCPSDELQAKLKEATRRSEALFRAITNENDEIDRVQADVPHRPPGTYDFRLGKHRERIEELQKQMAQAQADAKTLADAMRDY